MKQLLPDGSINIPSNSPRTRQGPDSRGIRICVAQLARSCALMQGYITFVDGSAYVYTAPSNAEFEALCASLQRGRQFNFQVRRSRSGYSKVFVPPSDFEVIYTYPPYPGIAPSACPVPPPPWLPLDWTVLSNTAPAGDSVFIDFDPGTGTFEAGSWHSDFGSVGGMIVFEGTSTYNGSGFAAGLESIFNSNFPPASISFDVSVTQDGVTVLSVSYNSITGFDHPDSFTLADTMGADSAVVVSWSLTLGILPVGFDSTWGIFGS